MLAAVSEKLASPAENATSVYIAAVSLGALDHHSQALVLANKSPSELVNHSSIHSRSVIPFSKV